jgi:uncharacterized membrane protein YqaE (UPF0057 family)
MYSDDEFPSRRLWQDQFGSTFTQTTRTNVHAGFEVHPARIIQTATTAATTAARGSNRPCDFTSPWELLTLALALFFPPLAIALTFPPRSPIFPITLGLCCLGWFLSVPFAIWAICSRKKLERGRDPYTNTVYDSLYLPVPRVPGPTKHTTPQRIGTTPQGTDATPRRISSNAHVPKEMVSSPLVPICRAHALMWISRH